jgi:hypothetical protein
MRVTAPEGTGAAGGITCLSGFDPAAGSDPVSFWYRVVDGNAQTLEAEVQFFSTSNCSGTTLSPDQFVSVQPPNYDGNWHQVSGTVSAPSGSKSIALALLVRCIDVCANPDGVSAWFDDVVLQLPDCSDKQDNDGDGLTDYPNDPGCQSAADTSEVNPTLSINDVTVTEGNSGTTNATFTVTKTGASDATVRVHYATADGSATAPSDYGATQGDLSFSPNETTKTVTVGVVGDTTPEPDETFVVNLSSAANAAISDGQGTGTITNDDVAAAPTFSISDATVTEGNSGTTNATFTVAKAGPPGASASVAYATADGTATAPSDYQSTSGTLSFGTGETQKSVTVPVVGDTVVEPDETFVVNLSSPTHATIGDGQGVGTITNDDSGTPPPPPPNEPVLVDAAAEPPPLPLPARGTIVVQILGNGTVKTRRPRRLTADGPVQQINCGMQGLSCYSQTDPGQQVTMSASPSQGYQFTGWVGACTGNSQTCTVRANAVRNVGATFAPKQGVTPVRVKLRQTSVKVRWVRSVGRGTLLVRGGVNRKANVRLELRRPGGGPLLVRKRSLRGGKFRLSAPLRAGKLLRGAKPLPGPFVVSLRGRSQGSSVPLQVRTFNLRGPKEGVVRNAYVSASRTGVAVPHLPAGATQAWVTFRMSTRPQLRPIVVRWYKPNGELLGTKEKTDRPNIKTGIGGVAIPSGRWRCDLTAGGRVVSRRFVRVG